MTTGANQYDFESTIRRKNMGVCKTCRTFMVYGLAIIGLLTVLFVLLSYGWDGQPPEVHLEGEGE